MIKATWLNGMPVTHTEAIEVLMYWYGEDASQAEKDLSAITPEKLQDAVNYYATHATSLALRTL